MRCGGRRARIESAVAVGAGVACSGSESPPSSPASRAVMQHVVAPVFVLAWWVYFGGGLGQSRFERMSRRALPWESSLFACSARGGRIGLDSFLSGGSPQVGVTPCSAESGHRVLARSMYDQTMLYACWAHAWARGGRRHGVCPNEKRGGPAFDEPTLGPQHGAAALVAQRSAQAENPCFGLEGRAVQDHHSKTPSATPSAFPPTRGGAYGRSHRWQQPWVSATAWGSRSLRLGAGFVVMPGHEASGGLFPCFDGGARNGSRCNGCAVRSCRCERAADWCGCRWVLQSWSTLGTALTCLAHVPTAVVMTP